MIARGVLFGIALSALVACGEVGGNNGDPHDAGPSTSHDAEVVIDASRDHDAAPAPDAPPPVESGPPATEVTSGGAQVSSATYRVQLQLGHSFQQVPASGGSSTVTSAAAVAR